MKQISILIILIFAESFIFTEHARSQITLGSQSREKRINELIEHSSKIFAQSSKEALESTRTAIQIAKSMDKPKILAEVLYEHGFFFFRSGLSDSAYIYLSESLEISKTINDSVGIARALNRIGNVFSRKDEHVLALETHKEALRYLEGHTDFKEKGRIYNNIANLYRNWGDFEKALQNYTLALENYQISNFREGLAWLNFSLTMLYKNLGNYENALEAVNKSLELYKMMAMEQNDSTGIMLCYGQLGDIYLRLGKYQQGLDYHSAALKLRRKSGIKMAIADGLSGVGQALYFLGKYDQAISKISESMAIQRKYGTESMLTTNYKYLGFIYQRLDNSFLALKNLKQGLTIANSSKQFRTKKEILHTLSQIYAEQGRFDLAYQYEKERNDVMDSIFTSEVANRTASMQVLYEIEEKENENKLLARDIRIKELTIEQSRALRNFLLFAIFVFISASIWIIYLYYRKTKANILLKYKNDEIEQSHILLEQEIEERRVIEEEREKLISELQESLARIKTLSGLIPICAHCKNIRNDQGYYEKLEHYIMNHSDVVFSHGICPDCATKLYPEFVSKKDPDK